jgi:DNA invertase Pin-like site-specific DNA recombinase
MREHSTNGDRERAAAYCRSSDDKQEASVGQQLQWARQKAEVSHLDLAVIRYDEFITGDVIDRPGLEALFADLAREQKARRPVPVLLLFDQDRLSRATSWATGAIMERLTALGVERLVTASRTIDLYSDTDRGLFSIEQDFGKRAYSKSLSRNVSRAMASLAAAGCWTGGSPPYGYAITGEKNRRHLVPGLTAEVEAYQALAAEAARGVLSTTGLARLAGERGWPVPPASALRQKGRTPGWTAYTVGRLLRQRVYLGEIHYGRRRKGKYHQAAEGGPVERRGSSQKAEPVIVRTGCHEPLIDVPTFDRIQALLDSRRVERHLGRCHPQDFAFSGRLVCGCCGGVMQGRKVRTQRGRRAFHGYVCGTWHQSEPGHRRCSRNSISESRLMDTVASLLARELDSPATLSRLRKRLEARRTACGEVQRAALEKGRRRVADLEARVARGNRRLLSVADDLLPGAENELRRLQGELATVRVDLAGLEKQAAARLAEGQDTEELLSRLSQLPALLRVADGEQRVRVVQAAALKITLRFAVRKTASGRLRSKWEGGTLILRGGGPARELSVPPGSACRCR